MKRFRLTVMSLLLFSIVILTSCGAVTDFIFRGMNNLPKGEFLATYDSPAKTYSINIYLCGGGATVDFSVRGELFKHGDNTKKNIYWCYHEQEADVKWLDEEMVVINGRRLNVLKDVYDWRK